MAFKDLSIRKDGDIIEVVLRDDGFNPFFQVRARIKDKKSMQNLVKELKNKGVNINQHTSEWF